MAVTQTPLAWKNLTHDRRRLMTAIAGIGFAVMLMFMQLGFLFGLLDSTVKLIEEMDADLIVAHRLKYAMPSQQRLELREVYRARSLDFVSECMPVYIENYQGILRIDPDHASTLEGKVGKPIRVIACDADSRIFRFGSIGSLHPSILDPDAALFDQKSKRKYQVRRPCGDPVVEPGTRLGTMPLRLVGEFSLGSDFANDGNIMMTDRNFAKFFPYRNLGADPLDLIDLAVVRLKSGVDATIARKKLQERLSSDALVYTKGEFSAREKRFWRGSTPIGFIFSLGAALGFVVGIIICYQIISADISDHLAEFATLKAIGYRNSFFVWLILAESFYLCCFGFVPGWIVSWLLYEYLASLTGLSMIMTPVKVIVVYIASLAMCIVSGCIAMRRLFSADPASLFK